MSSEELHLPMPWGHVAAKTWGSPKDERVLLVHGILDNAGTFDRLITLLPHGYYFVCIDLPGHGLSSHFPVGMPLDYFNYVLSIRRVLDHLKWETCIYIGHSLGGNLGIMFSAIYPERVIKILCFDAVSSSPVSNDKLVTYLRRVHDNALSITEEGMTNVKLYTEEEVMYTLMNLRISALNIGAAKALMKRSVTKVGNKYKFNRDPRLKVGLLPVLNYEQHAILIAQLEIPISIILASATVSGIHNKGLQKLISVISSDKKINITSVEGNHDFHNNHPERVASHVSRFLGGIKSSL